MPEIEPVLATRTYKACAQTLAPYFGSCPIALSAYSVPRDHSQKSLGDHYVVLDRTRVDTVQGNCLNPCTISPDLCSNIIVSKGAHTMVLYLGITPSGAQGATRAAGD